MSASAVFRQGRARRRAIGVAAGLLAMWMIAVPVLGDGEKDGAVSWQAKDTAGRDVVVPDAQRMTVVVFGMAGQQRSAGVLRELDTLFGEDETVQLIAVVSGAAAATDALKLARSVGWQGPMVADADYAVSGRFDVHVWPSTAVVGADGRELGRIAGSPASFAKDMQTYLAFAHGQIDRAVLDERLAAHQHVASTPGHVAERHLHVAERLLERGQVEQARDQLLRGLEASGDDARLHLLLARAQILMGQPAEALQRLDALGAGAAGRAERQTLRGRALVALGRFEQAGEALTEALPLNPDPAEAHYFLARVHQQQGQWELAAKHYRAAYEHSAAGQAIAEHEKRDGEHEN